MATAQLKDSKLKLTFDTGVDAKGMPIFKVKILHNIRLIASAEQLYDIADSLATLSKKPLFAVERADSMTIRR